METTLTKKTDVFLREYTAANRKKTLKDLKGKIRFREDYNYKLMRETR